MIDLHVVRAISVSKILGDITPQRGRKWPVRILGDGNIFDESFDSITALARDLSKPTPEHWLKPDRGRMAVNDYASGWDTRDSARAGRGLYPGSLGVRRGPPGRGCPAGQGGSQISSPSARYKRSSYIPLRRVLEARNGSGSWLGFVTTLPAITTAFVRARPFCGCGPLLVFGALCAFHVVDRPACSTRHLCFEKTRRYNTATRT